MANLGSLVVSLEANMAKFQSDMGKAAQSTEQAMQKMSAAANLVQGALAGIGAGISVGAFVAIVRGSIDAADHLRDMSQKTGIAVETLNGLAFAAGQAGGNLESIVAAAGKANKSIVEAAGGNKDSKEAFDKLGISVRDASGQLKTADVVMAEVADQFVKFADGPQKTAIAVRIFGKAGADMIPVLNDGGKAMRENIEYAKKYSGVTAELAAASDEFNDTMGKLTVQQKSFGNAIATATLPILQAVASEYLAASEQSDKFALASAIVRTVLETFVVVGSEVAFTFKAVGNEIGGIVAQLGALAHGDMKGFTAISDAMREDAEKARKEHDEFIKKVLDRTPKAVDASGAPTDTTKPAAPTLRAKGDDPTKSLLEGRLKVIESAYASERNVSTFHNQFMDALRGQSIVDLQTYEDFKKASIEGELESAERAYDAEIKALQNYRATAGKETERAQADAQIREKIALKEQAQIKAKNDLQLLDLSNQKTRHDLVKKWQAESDAISAQDEANFLSLHKSLMTAAEAENQAYTERMEAAVRFRNDQVANVELANAAIEREDKRHAEAMQSLRLSAAQNILGIAESSAGQLYDALQKAGMEQTALGKAMFYAQKAIQVATIIVNTEVAAAAAQAGMIAAAGATAAVSGPAGPAILAEGIAAGAVYAAVTRAMGYATAGLVAGTALSGAREAGGPVWSGGAFLVGEKGPEIFKPSGSGTIIPNHKLGVGGGEMKITIINQTSGRIDHVEERQISPSERALIISEAVSATASQLSDPNSKTSRAMSRNYSVPRTR